MKIRLFAAVFAVMVMLTGCVQKSNPDTELSREETRLGPALEEILRGLQAGKALPGLLGGCADRWGLSPWCRTAMEELGCALGGDEGESGEALAFARHRILEELEEKRQSQGERERRSTALCFSGAALVILLLL